MLLLARFGFGDFLPLAFFTLYISKQCFVNNCPVGVLLCTSCEAWLFSMLNISRWLDFWSCSKNYRFWECSVVCEFRYKLTYWRCILLFVAMYCWILRYVLSYALNTVYFLCYASSLLHCFVGFAFVNLVSLWCEELTEMVVYHWTGPSGGIFSSSTRVVTLKTLSSTGGNHWYFSHVLLLQRWSSEVGSWNFFSQLKSYTLWHCNAKLLSIKV